VVWKMGRGRTTEIRLGIKSERVGEQMMRAARFLVHECGREFFS